MMTIILGGFFADKVSDVTARMIRGARSLKRLLFILSGGNVLLSRKGGARKRNNSMLLIESKFYLMNELLV